MVQKGDSTSGAGSLAEELVAVGAYYGRRRARRHPSCTFALAATKDGIDIINLTVTLEQIAAAKRVLRAAGETGVVVLWVSARPEGRMAVRDIATTLGHPYVAGRWLGGTLTNLPELRKRLRHLTSLRQMREEGIFEQRYTKRERLMLEREMRALEEDFEGLLPLMDAEPHLAVVVDPTHTPVAAEELAAQRVPFVGLISTDGNCSAVPYPIVCNVGSRATVSRVLAELRAAYEEGVAAKKETPVMAPAHSNA
ncbi:MAG: 30S ribosomal protein S2 [Candidatus Parcubacteria bacterium]|nr:MAG: 30S ribosomal protein S2 [Candidatus Parcubacteria bacterium]